LPFGEEGGKKRRGMLGENAEMFSTVLTTLKEMGKERKLDSLGMRARPYPQLLTQWELGELKETKLSRKEGRSRKKYSLRRSETEQRERRRGRGGIAASYRYLEEPQRDIRLP